MRLAVHEGKDAATRQIAPSLPRLSLFALTSVCGCMGGDTLEAGGIMLGVDVG